MAILYITSKLNKHSTTFDRHKLTTADLKGTIKNLCEEIASKLNIIRDDFELVFMGRCLDPDEILETCGIKQGMTVFVLPKCNAETQPKTVEPPSETEINNLVLALRTALLNPAFRSMLQTVSKPEIVENIVAATPGLADDPTALAILQDPELLLLLADPTHIQRVVELHPALAHAATHLTAAFHEEASSSSLSQSSSSAPPVSYSLDAMSDDDDMDTEMAAMGLPSTGQITPNQLATALAAVGSSPLTIPRNNSSIPPSSPHLQAPPSTPRSLITPEMFTSAMQQALGVMSTGTLESQMQQLRDMGIRDDAVSMRALQVTGGNVQAALELIFEEFGGEDL